MISESTLPQRIFEDSVNIKYLHVGGSFVVKVDVKESLKRKLYFSI